MRVILSGGGTAGHIMPAIAVAESLKAQNPDTEILYIGAHGGMEERLVPPYGLDFQGVRARKLRKLLSLSTLPVAYNLLLGYYEAKRYVKAFKADVVLSTGGYVAAAASLAGVKSGIPLVICAPDAVPGRTNLLLARYAKKISVVFPSTSNYFQNNRCEVTGLPLRKGIVAESGISQADAVACFDGLRMDCFTVLVLGGSQGAVGLNSVVLEGLPRLNRESIQIIHQTGERNFAFCMGEVERLGIAAQYHPVAFIDQRMMAMAQRAADLVVCRGGINTLSELLLNHNPAIVVPLPSAYADHQTANARELVAHGAAQLLPEPGLSGEMLADAVLQLRRDPERRMNMAKGAALLAKPDAADRVARLLMDH